MVKIKSAPFIRSKTDTKSIMLDVIIALIPVSIMAVVKFGYRSLILILTGIISSVLFEYLYQRLSKKEVTISDLSACVTGLLVGLSYSITTPIYVIILGSFIAIVLVKQIPGGLGHNPFNPAVFSRVFNKIIFTPLITNWVSPLPDMTSSATPLSYIGNGQNFIPQAAYPLSDLFFGNIGGNIGETVKWAIILGFIYLCFKRIISPLVPLATLSGLFFTMLLFGKSDYYYALYHVLSGTAMFAAVFMVTDYTSGPAHHKARVYYALGIGILTGVIRYVFNLPGGMGVAILIMNMLSPIFDLSFNPVVFGYKR
ncbi:MAG: RnfABCDGE type electron transport complex subunit D [Finegoldia sp.]|nr:RnfABCDGE type electron transport complex subunit D [Finegoldia sp.]